MKKGGGLNSTGPREIGSRVALQARGSVDGVP